jgi:FSR family fosmidomycin resistance protein-like MFS transporter
MGAAGSNQRPLGTAWLIIPPALAAVFLAGQMGHLNPRLGLPAGDRGDLKGAPAEDQWIPFLRLAGVAAGRSGVYFGLQAFVAVYFIEQLGASTTEGNAALSVMLVAGAIGTLVGGQLADRLGRRTVLVGFLATLTPLLLLLPLATPETGLVLLAVVGFFCLGNFSIIVVMGQKLLPGRTGVASGVTVGAAIGAGGLIAAALGILADHVGLTGVMLTIAALPLPTLALAVSLPPDPSPSPSVRPR